MSPSSVESRRSSGGSEPHLDAPVGDGFIARLERAVAPYAQRFTEAHAVRALQGTLPVALGVALVALLARFAVVLLARPFAGWAACARAIVAFSPSAFAIASVVMIDRAGVAACPAAALPHRSGLAVTAFASFWFMACRVKRSAPWACSR